jgi:polyisoprenoid-binding protein YceI
MHRAIATWTYSLLVVALGAWPRLSPCAPLQADTSASTLVIRASKAGLLSAIAHDHQFAPARWQAEVNFDPRHPQEVRVDVRLDAATLHDQVARLTQKVRDHIDRETAGPGVLDAQRFPEIGFHGESASARVEGAELRGVLHGTLSLHGTTRPLDVPFHARAEAAGYRVAGSVRFRQTDFGITPVSKAGGSIGVDDEVQVDFDLLLVAATRPGGSPTRLGAR